MHFAQFVKVSVHCKCTVYCEAILFDYSVCILSMTCAFNLIITVILKTLFALHCRNLNPFSLYTVFFNQIINN